ncbi:hypothetical protein BDW74DRAFT_157087 [Aspergillus multicolor]|uniref:uncharacterized protein n=1 Tax=Aspergillus multicolor TaxID=41759 RepID=UPI003CCE155C
MSFSGTMAELISCRRAGRLRVFWVFPSSSLVVLSVPDTGSMRDSMRNATRPMGKLSTNAFDVSISDTLNALLVGACLCIPSNEERSSRVAEGIRRL